MTGTRLSRGTLALLSCEQLEARFCLSGVAFIEHVIASSGTPFESIYAADIDGDGDMDALSAGRGVSWYENTDGRGNFGPAEQVYLGNTALAVTADLDGDGDEDVIGSYGPDEFGVALWFENMDGEGDFSQSGGLVGASPAHEMAMYAADVDGDADVDVLSTCGSSDEVAWFENSDGAGTFGPETFAAENTIALRDDLGGTHPSVHPTDLDGDGDMDILVAGSSKAVWYQNTDGAGTFQQRLIAGLPSNSIHAADVDGDGDPDIVSRTCATAEGTSGSIVWYENTDGKGTFALFPGQPTEWNDACRWNYWPAILSPIYAADVDGDTDLDIVSASSVFGVREWESEIAWYENTDGKGAFGGQQTVATEAARRAIHVADVDGDGDVDVLAASTWWQGYRVRGRLVWYESFSPEPGDANRDGEFSQQDIVRVLQCGKYLTRQPATWAEGDWNGDGVFDQLDIVQVLQASDYLQGPDAARGGHALPVAEAMGQRPFAELDLLLAAYADGDLLI